VLIEVSHHLAFAGLTRDGKKIQANASNQVKPGRQMKKWKTETENT
jgi:hypothetical protein